MSDLKLETSRRISAPIERVFNAWLDPVMLARFMRPDEGVHVPKADVDARVGGRFTIVMTVGDKDIPHAGEYKEINRHSKIAFTWESPFSQDDSLVTLSLSEAGPGATDLKLAHVKFPSEESRDNYREGWSKILEMLDKTLA